MTAGTGSVGIRLSAWQPLVDLLCRVGPVTGTSANREGLPPPRTVEEVQHSLGDALDLIIDAGPTPGGRPSTVIDVRDPIRIIRDGSIERGAIAAQLAAHGLHVDADSREVIVSSHERKTDDSKSVVRNLVAVAARTSARWVCPMRLMASGTSTQIDNSLRAAECGKEKVQLRINSLHYEVKDDRQAQV